MGKWTEKSYDNEFMKKVKILFDEVMEKLNKEQPDTEFTYEKFVESFDETDKFNRRLFEFLIKETVQKRNRTRNSANASQHRPYGFPFLHGMNSRNTPSSAAMNSGGLEAGGYSDNSQPPSIPSLSSQMRSRGIRSGTLLEDASGSIVSQSEEGGSSGVTIRRILHPYRVLPRLSSSVDSPLQDPPS